jgi:hypothetical protein
VLSFLADAWGLGMRYWWVNQNQTFRQEIAGGYLWSPKRNANGARIVRATESQFPKIAVFRELGSRVPTRKVLLLLIP